MGARSSKGLTDAELVELSKAGGLLTALFGPRVDESEAFLDRLVALHNAEQIDLLALPLDQLAELENSDFFNGFALLYRMIPRLGGEPLVMMRLVNALVERAGQDGMANIPNEAYLNWAKSDLKRARTGLELEAAGNVDSRKLLRCNLEAGNFVELAIEMTALPEQERRLPALFALSRMPLPDVHIDPALSALKALIEAFPDDVTAANALHAALEIASRHALLEQPLVSEVVFAALKNAGPQTHYAAASSLLGLGRDLPASIVAPLLETLYAVDRAHTRTIDTLDSALADLLEGPHADLAEAAIERLLTAQEQAIPVAALQSCGRSLLKLPDERLSRLIARWLLSDHHALREGWEQVFSLANRKEALAFTLAGQNLTPIKQLLLCRRACGYFFIRPELAASILVGVLREGDPETLPHVQELLYDPLASNYGGMARDYLAAIPKTDPAFAAVAPVVKRLEVSNGAQK